MMNDPTDNPVIVVLITVPSLEVGQTIARSLVEQKLAACVNLLPAIRSVYAWQGAVQDEEEVLLIAKTRRSLFEGRFVPAVKALHPYEVPEIIALPVEAGSQSYLDWISAETQTP